LFVEGATQAPVIDMNEFTIAVGTKENIAGDIHALGKKWSHDAQVIVASGKDIRAIVLEKASALFLEENLVLILVDPDKTVFDELTDQLDMLREQIHVVIYTTSALPEYLKKIAGNISIMDKDKETRMRKSVLAFLKQYDKKMTDKAFRVLVERIKDESVIESELMKLVNYIGEKPSIDSKDIQAIVVEMHEENLITLFEAIAKMDKKGVLTIFENLLTNGIHILAIHSYLARQIRLLLQAKDMEELYRANPDYATFVKTFGTWKEGLEIKTSEKKHYFPHQKPFYAHKLSKASRKIPRQTLISFFNNLTMTDGRIKSVSEGKMRGGVSFEQVHLECDLLET
jgi:DNA polymerase III delta subunit